MKAYVGGFLVASLVAGSVSFAKTQEEQKACQEKVDAKKTELRKALDLFELGEVTIIEVTDAKLGVAEQVYSCGAYVKYNYCKYRMDLLKFKLRKLNEANLPAGPTEDAIADFKDFCMHPGASSGQ